MAKVNGDEFQALWAAIAELRAEIRAGLQDVREVQREHTARLDEHFEFHQAHAAAFAMLADTAREHGGVLREHGGMLREHGEMLRAILLRLDAA